jgi:thiamine biosynthesis lipoprotein
VPAVNALTADRPTWAAADWEAWTCRVRVAVTDPAALPVARAELESRLAAVDLACSRFRGDSELAGVERAAGNWTAVSPLLVDLLDAGLSAARATDGDVDPTVGTALTALGYDRDLAAVLPGGVVVTAPAPGWRAVELDGDGGRVRLPRGVRVDLGATAKAWTADAAATAITERTGTGCLVSLGGDIAVAGAPPHGGWGIRVQDVSGDPAAPPVGPSAVVTIRTGGLATSSTSARRWQHGGQEWHHLIDPRTGMPPTASWRTVSVAAESCLAANTASTAAIIRGDRAVPWLGQLGLPARLAHDDGRLVTVGGWPQEQA